MRRKLVFQGASTYTVSLPKEWVQRFGLKAGEEINLEETGMQLVLSSIQKQNKYQTITYDFSEVPQSLVHEYIVSIYKSGMQDIEIENINPDKLKLAKEVINNSIGFEILGSQGSKVHIVDLGNSDEESIVKAEQQIYWRLLNMIDRVLDKNSKEKEIKDIDLEVNRLAFFIQRNLAAKFSNNPKNFLRYEKVSVLESIGDFLRSFKKYSKLGEPDLEYLKKIYKILDCIRSQKSGIGYFSELRQNLLILENMAEKNNKQEKGSSALASILLYKNLKQLFEISLTLKIEEFIKK